MACLRTFLALYNADVDHAMQKHLDFFPVLKFYVWYSSIARFAAGFKFQGIWW